MNNPVDELSEEMKKLCNSLEKLTNMINAFSCAVDQGVGKEKTLNILEKQENIYDKQFVLNTMHYENVMTYHRERRFYMVALKDNEIFSFEKNNGLLLLLNKVYRGGFDCKEDILFNSSCYVDYIVKCIQDNWKEIIKIRFGLDGGIVLSQDEIKRVFCTSLSEVRDIECRCINRLRRQLKRVRHLKGEGRHERKVENVLLTISDYQCDLIRIEPVSCKLVDLMNKNKLETFRDLESNYELLKKYGVEEETIKLLNYIQ